MSQSPLTGQFNFYIIISYATQILLESVSIPSNGSIQFLLRGKAYGSLCGKSQSPLTGQFNFYSMYLAFFRNMSIIVSIPSNGSIQFLSKFPEFNFRFQDGISVSIPSNGSIQFLWTHKIKKTRRQTKSQSPLTGQFNFYHRLPADMVTGSQKVSIPSNGSIQFLFNTHRPIPY